MKQVYIAIQGMVAAFIAWLSAKMGILLPVMGVLMGADGDDGHGLHHRDVGQQEGGS